MNTPSASQPSVQTVTRQGKCTCGVQIIITFVDGKRVIGGDKVAASSVTDIYGHPHLCPESRGCYRP